jgi:hypothetical protein
LEPRCRHLLRQLLLLPAVLPHPLLSLYCLPLLLLLRQGYLLLLLPGGLRCCRETSLRPWCLRAPQACSAPWLLPLLPQHQWLSSSTSMQNDIRQNSSKTLLTSAAEESLATTSAEVAQTTSTTGQP